MISLKDFRPALGLVSGSIRAQVLLYLVGFGKEILESRKEKGG